jgi:hypothetical protein
MSNFQNPKVPPTRGSSARPPAFWTDQRRWGSSQGSPAVVAALGSMETVDQIRALQTEPGDQWLQQPPPGLPAEQL